MTVADKSIGIVPGDLRWFFGRQRDKGESFLSEWKFFQCFQFSGHIPAATPHGRHRIA